MGLDLISQMVSTKSALIALIVMTCIASTEAGFIGGLISRVGSIRNLLRLSSRGDNQTYNASKKRSPTTNNIKD